MFHSAQKNYLKLFVRFKNAAQLITTHYVLDSKNNSPLIDNNAPFKNNWSKKNFEQWIHGIITKRYLIGKR